MKIALLTLGTRGDVQPYAVLGKAFQHNGHEVTLSTGKNFSQLAHTYGLKFIPVEADFQALINSPEGKAMMKNPFLARKHFRSVVHPMMLEAMKRFFDVAKEADCVLYHVKSLADYFADQFPGKMIRANVIPAIRPTSEFPNPVFSGLSLPRFLNRFTYKLADLGLAMMNQAIRDFRHSSGLDPKFLKKINLTELYGISETFLKKPQDFPANSFFTGFWFGESPEELSQDIVDFIASAKKTIVVTFSSMPFQTNFNLEQSLVKISTELGVNVLVVKGWGFENMRVDENRSLKIIESAPFDKLFPRVSAVVHHGGIGTLSLCLRAGVPSLSCPVIFPMGDQHFWGNHAYKVGCGVRPIPLKKLNHDGLTRSISEMLSNRSLHDNCKKMASVLATEDGLRNAINVVESQRRI
jgi:sterol 3beta-glucosyltransferase